MACSESSASLPARGPLTGFGGGGRVVVAGAEGEEMEEVVEEEEVVGVAVGLVDVGEDEDWPCLDCNKLKF